MCWSLKKKKCECESECKNIWREEGSGTLQFCNAILDVASHKFKGCIGPVFILIPEFQITRDIVTDLVIIK